MTYAEGATHVVHHSSLSSNDAVTDILKSKLADIVIETAGETDSINLAISLAKENGFLLRRMEKNPSIISKNSSENASL